ncbi:TetR/AcrR family transcriptional regulator [Leptospira gomenensis]|uniref:TetR/AcrR family transcriptional regulator n=1 Tax=Leptospira gomenensis TaxID=2484974 RepID=A0A5F1Z3N1_9LEPT|nr:TetR/AcrR family transcriptional regulator [Leptospira gomenensis]TGK33431.1 TetR/AcrR family transcriptional regulator [Leptospira gomenensis]TGK40953.1 TetR/AcrR family transcriptional regulator [Leptospira gomenensis]TGK46377.1 TetR/AcrR family transcriptional regulator [Leptospira gomenensis]TGK67491.1 TetR/AcrR family transcriptional regulator [Leptospira gomenensis]
MEQLSSRDRLIQTTARLLQERGYHGTGLKEILKYSETPSGSLYHHFPEGKEQLTAEAISLAGERLENEMEMFAGLQRTAEQMEKVERTEATAQTVPVGPAKRIDLHGLGDVLREFTDHLGKELIQSGFQKGCPIATVVLEVAAENDRIQKVCSETYRKWENLVSSLLMKSGIDGPRSRSVALLLLSSIEGALVLSRAHRSLQPLEAVRFELENFLKELSPV